MTPTYLWLAEKVSAPPFNLMKRTAKHGGERNGLQVRDTSQELVETQKPD